MHPETYYVYSLLATAIGFSLTLISFVFVYLQLSAVNKNRETDILLRLYKISTEEPLSTDFDVVWDLNDTDTLKESQREACLRACLFFEMVGSITSQKYIKTLLIEEYFGSLVTGSFRTLTPYIREMRLKPYNNKFGLNFERLARSLSKSQRISRE